MPIYLIRHGKTEANEKHLYCGSSDLPLSEAGMTELTQLKQCYSLPAHCRYITSGMRRTEQTLKLLFGEISHQTEPNFREMDFGLFELHSYEDLKDTPAYQQWLAGDNEENQTPGGESGRMMEARVWKAFCALNDSSQPDQNLVIVTHGGVIAALMARLFPEEKKNRYQWQPRPGHGYRIAENTYEIIPKE